MLESFFCLMMTHCPDVAVLIHKTKNKIITENIGFKRDAVKCSAKVCKAISRLSAGPLHVGAGY